MSRQHVHDPRTLLRGLEQRARRRFGQHFLTRTSVVDAMVKRAGVQPGDRVIEIGPGLGILTDALLRAGAVVTAIELDRDLADHVAATFPEVELVRGDALDVNWPELVGDDGPVSVVANLPYNVGTRIVLQLLDQPAHVRRVAVMLQKEVVDRLLAVPGTKAYGSLTVQCAARAHAVYLLSVPPKAFHPPPKVDSAVLRLDVFDAPQTGGVEPRHFDRVVKAAFAQRRKTVQNSLGALFGRDEAARALAEAGLDPRLRAEQIDLDSYRRLSAALVPR